MGFCRRDATSFRYDEKPQYLFLSKILSDPQYLENYKRPTMRMCSVAGIPESIGFIYPHIPQTPIMKIQTFPDCSNVESDTTKYDALNLEKGG